MLATREDKRGQGVALLLGAHAIVALHEQHGFSEFFTGIKQGNIASERFCTKLGFVKTDTSVVFAIDTSVLP